VRDLALFPISRHALQVALVVWVTWWSGAAHAEWLDGVEKAMCISELVVLGRVTPPTQPGASTRYTLTVERYFKGAGPRTLVLIIPGGRWTDKNGIELLTSNPSGVGVTEGEEMLAFLEPYGDAYRFRLGRSGKYTVEIDPESGERAITLRWHSRQYMRGAALEAFRRMEEREAGPDQAVRVEEKLDGADGLYERVSVRALAERLKEVADGYSALRYCIADNGPTQGPGKSTP